jgi:glycerol-3-phosphate O-acyltransferase/dihydroxyacetone phosphate acyltransferase
MLYSILKPLVSITMKGYFKKIEVSGAEHLEYVGAIYVSNHPSAVFDPILAALSAKKELNFIASAEWFGKGVKEWIFRNELNMIPVYRPWLMKNGEKVDNGDMFTECYAHLEKGKRLIIYPEGSSITVSWLRELKTGAARIKLGAEASLNSGQEVKIVPIGLNYSNAHRFQNRVLVNVGSPIDFSSLDSQVFEDEKERAKAYTERIAEGMQAQLLHIQREEDAKLIKSVVKLLTDAMMKEVGLENNDTVGAFNIKKQIIKKIEGIKATNPEQLQSLENELYDYIGRFEALGFRRFNPFETSFTTEGKMLFQLIIGAPLLLLGTIINGIPYWFSEFFFRKNFLGKVTQEHKQGEINPSFAGTLAYGVGSISFLIWYIGLAIYSAQFGPFYITWPLTWFVGYQSGKFTLTYARIYRKYTRVLKWNKYKNSHAKEADQLLKDRESLLKQLMNL